MPNRKPAKIGLKRPAKRVGVKIVERLTEFTKDLRVQPADAACEDPFGDPVDDDEDETPSAGETP